MAIIAITTKSSIRVKACLLWALRSIETSH
jgi:hypothetical protein